MHTSTTTSYERDGRRTTITSETVAETTMAVMNIGREEREI